MKKKYIPLVWLITATSLLVSCGTQKTTTSTPISESQTTEGEATTPSIATNAAIANLKVTLNHDDGVKTMNIVERDNNSGYVVVSVQLQDAKFITEISVKDSDGKNVNFHQSEGNQRIIFTLKDKDVNVNITTSDKVDVKNKEVYSGLWQWMQNNQTMSFTNTLYGDYNLSTTTTYYTKDNGKTKNENYTTFRIASSSTAENLWDYFEDENGNLAYRYLGLDNTVTNREVHNTLNQPIPFKDSAYTTNILAYMAYDFEQTDTGAELIKPTDDATALNNLMTALSDSATINDNGRIVISYKPSGSEVASLTPYYFFEAMNAFYGYYVRLAGASDYTINIVINPYNYNVESFSMDLGEFSILSGKARGKIVFSDPSTVALEPDAVIPLTGTNDTSSYNSVIDSAFNQLAKVKQGNYTLNIDTENVGVDGLPAGYTTNFDNERHYQASVYSYLTDDDETKASAGYKAGSTTSNFIQVSDAPLVYNLGSSIVDSNSSSSSTTPVKLKNNISALYGTNDGTGKIQNALSIATIKGNSDSAEVLSQYTSTNSSNQTSVIPYYLSQDLIYKSLSKDQFSSLYWTDHTNDSVTANFSDKLVNSKYMSNDLFSYIDSSLDYAFGQALDDRMADLHGILSSDGVVDKVTFTVPDANSLTIKVEMKSNLYLNGSSQKYNTSATFTYTNIGKTKLKTITDKYADDIKLISDKYGSTTVAA